MQRKDKITQKMQKRGNMEIKENERIDDLECNNLKIIQE